MAASAIRRLEFRSGVSARLIQHDTSRVPAEFRGLTRAFIGRVKSAHARNSALVNYLTDLIERRHEKHPERSLPADMLADVARRWKAAQDDYRISFVKRTHGTKGVICEGRVGFQGLIHSSWENASEPNVVAYFAPLSVTRSQARVTVRVEHTFSAHSIARFYERTGCRDDRDVIGAMISALVIDPKEHQAGADVHAGSWRGVIKSREVGEDRLLVWCARVGAGLRSSRSCRSVDGPSGELQGFVTEGVTLPVLSRQPRFNFTEFD